MINKEQTQKQASPDQATAGNDRQTRQQEDKEYFIPVRLTGDELDRVKKIALKSGMGPSTYTRLILLERINRETAETAGEGGGSAPEKASNTELQNSICIFDIGSAKVNPDIMQSLLYTLNEACDCTILAPRDIGYEEAEQLIKERLEI